ncbi:MAG: Fe-S cluster assembly protein SufD [Gammaproteobacteria bacterium]
MQVQLQNLYSTYAANLPGQNQAWLHTLRDQAFADFAQQGIPTVRSEAWKYTNLHRINSQNYLLLEQVNHQESIEKLPIFSESMRLVFIDGIFSQTLSKINREIKFNSFNIAVQQQPELLKKFLEKSTTDPTSAFPALNASLAIDGAVLEILPAQNAGIIEIVYYTTAQAETTLVQPRTIIVCAENSQATIIEHYAGAQTTRSLTNSVTQIDIHANAMVEHIKLQTEAKQTDHIGQLFVTQQQSSHFKSIMLSYGANIARNEIHSVFAGEHSKTELYGLFLAQRSQHMDQYTLIDHAASHCQSRELYRGILTENARGVFNGRIIVKANVHKSNVKQTNNNLLLSPMAEIDTKPELQIYNDDLVQCTHGATVGQLDSQALFYLRARGLSLEQAKSLLLYAFTTEILHKVSDNNLQQKLQHQIFGYFPEMEWLEQL